MPATFDYVCLKCSRQWEETFPPCEGPDVIPCRCGGLAKKTWLTAPVMSADIWNPVYDVQLGCYIKSKAHLRQILEEKGLVAVGPDEYQRNLSTCHNQDGDDDTEPVDHGAFREAAEKAYHDTVSGNIPLTPARQLTEEQTASMLTVD